MIDPKILSRIAGLVGCSMLVTGSYARFVGTSLIVRNDALTTANNIIASETLFRLGILSSFVMILGFVAYGLILYRLLKPVHKPYATLMVILVLLSVPIFMLNQVNQIAILHLATNQAYDLMKLFLDLHKHGNLITAIFFGLWLFPLGLLVFKSGYLPKILGVLLMLGSSGYLVLFIQGFLFPGLQTTLWSNPFLVLTHISELSLMLWLLVMGVNSEGVTKITDDCLNSSVA